MKIELSEEELLLLEKSINGELGYPSPDVRDVLGRITERAFALEQEICPDEDHDDMLLWYYEKYKKQEGK